MRFQIIAVEYSASKEARCLITGTLGQMSSSLAALGQELQNQIPYQGGRETNDPIICRTHQSRASLLNETLYIWGSEPQIIECNWHPSSSFEMNRVLSNLWSAARQSQCKLIGPTCELDFPPRAPSALHSLKRQGSRPVQDEGSRAICSASW